MLTNEFCVRGKFWEKDPHTHSHPPLSVVGVSNNFQEIFTGWKKITLEGTHVKGHDRGKEIKLQ
jgi:hypothetical protein